jgi:hypothetical protein
MGLQKLMAFWQWRRKGWQNIIGGPRTEGHISARRAAKQRKLERKCRVGYGGVPLELESSVRRLEADKVVLLQHLDLFESACLPAVPTIEVQTINTINGTRGMGDNALVHIRDDADEVVSPDKHVCFVLR